MRRDGVTHGGWPGLEEEGGLGQPCLCLIEIWHRELAVSWFSL
jgi:hypothetical protein